MAYADQKASNENQNDNAIKMRDQDIENRIKVIDDILEMGSDLQHEPQPTSSARLTLPLNISQSIFQTLINILTNEAIVPP